MPQPPLHLTSIIHSGGQWLSKILTYGMQFSENVVIDNNYESNTLYYNHTTLDKIPFKKSNVAVILRDPRDCCVMAARACSNPKTELRRLIKQGSPDPAWHRSYMKYYNKVSHWRFSYEELQVDPIPIFKFLIHYKYLYSADLVRQEYERRDCLQCKIECDYHYLGKERIEPMVKSGLLSLWQDVFTDEQREEYLNLHSDLLKVFGYI